MRIVHIVPGSGDSFYCQNCIRDRSLVKALRAAGHDAMLVPLYLPPPPASATGHIPVFFGAVNVYLEQVAPRFHRALPGFAKRLLDSGPLLRLAASRAGSTRASGLEEMTLSMLRGEHGRQAEELGPLIEWLRGEGRPDVVHLSNALLLGLAGRIRRELGCPVFCSLQDEDAWVDAMSPESAAAVRDLMHSCSDHVTGFTAVSRWYGAKMRGAIGFPPEKLRIVYPGVEAAGRGPATNRPSPPVIGFLSRLSESLGLGILADAFLRLRQRPEFANIRLRAAGGMTADDRRFVGGLRRKLDAAGAGGDVELIETFAPDDVPAFLQSLTVLSVPVPSGEAFGLFIPEALSCGVPVVQPAAGAFPEVIDAVGGGIVYEPGKEHALADALAALLTDTRRLDSLAVSGRARVLAEFSVEKAAERMLAVYSDMPGCAAAAHPSTH